MTIIDDLLAGLPKEPVALRDVRVGAFWTVVWTERGAGLAATQQDPSAPHGQSLVRWAGDLLSHTAQELAGLLRSACPMEMSLGMAAVNALLGVDNAALTDRNAADTIVLNGAGKRAVIVGHFPFIPRVREAVDHLDVLEMEPGPDELSPEAASEVVPQADVVAITGTTLLNGTFDSLIRLCRPDAFVLLLGPTTPLAPVLFDYGVDLVAGTRVIDPVIAITTAGQGAIFRQMRGVRLVTMTHSSHTGEAPRASTAVGASRAGAD